MPVGPGSVLDALEAVRAAGVGIARGFLLDAARGVREAARAFGAVRPGVPAVLSQARLSRTADRDDVAAGARRAGASRRAAGRRAARARALFAGRREERAARSSEIELDARLTVSDREVLREEGLRADERGRDRAGQGRDQARWCCRSTRCKTRRLAPHRARPPHRSAPHAARQHEGRRRARST